MEGRVRGQSLGKFTQHASLEEARVAHDGMVAKKASSKAWTRVEVSEIPTRVGDIHRYEQGSFAWTLAVIDNTTLDTTTYRSGAAAGGNIVKCADVVERDSKAELLIAEKIATGYVRVGGPTSTQRFTAAGALVKD